LFGFIVVCCAPDFDSLSREPAVAAGGGAPATGGAPPTAGAAGRAGAGGLELCAFSHPGAIAFDGFDGGLSGLGFALATTMSSVSTVNDSTAGTAWDAAVGLTCPGSLQLRAVFKGYSNTATAEKAIGDLRFTTANWTGAVALHASVKVDPATAPLQSVTLFVLSGTDFRFDTITDETSFRNGEWNEMVLPLQAGTAFDPTAVARIGLNMVLKPAGTAGNPKAPPTTNAWLDDVWLEK
jgi:hypothetical protein